MGNQTSVFMSESLDGFSVAATRQNAGKSEDALLVASGVLNVPAVTTCAEVIDALGNASRSRPSQGCAGFSPVATAGASAPANTYRLSREQKSHQCSEKANCPTLMQGLQHSLTSGAVTETDSESQKEICVQMRATLRARRPHSMLWYQGPDFSRPDKPIESKSRL